MEFTKLVEERKRMCKVTGGCFNCPMHDFIKTKDIKLCRIIAFEFPAEVEKIVSKWSAENPKETRLTKLLKEYPNTKMSEISKVPSFCVKRLGYTGDNCHTTHCDDCWNKEV